MAGCGTQWTSLLVLLCSALVTADDEDAHIVTLEQGQVQGYYMEQNGTDLRYLAFEGIPYAAPPVGSLRFKDPEKPESWSGIKNATKAGPICIQKNLITEKVEGEEDCLFINVYTAKPVDHRKQQKIPVVVWIHSGYFLTGSGNLNLFGPGTLLMQGVIVVTIQYRLGIMGFLNTRDNQAPGNAGIKDVVMALRWVQKNIEAFGGDSKKVTILGNGAGGAIVNHLLLTPDTKGLFQGAVSMSGVALSPWTHDPDPRASALALRAHFDDACANITDPDTDVVSCLQSIDAQKLVASQDSAPPPHWEFRLWKTPFVPSLEAPGSSAAPLISSPPEQLMRAGRFPHVPYIAGFTSAESNNSLFRWINSTQWTDIEEKFNDLFTWAMPPGLATTKAVNEMRTFYLGNRTLSDAAADSDTRERFWQMCSDLSVAISTVSAARLLAQSGVFVYLYEFALQNVDPVLGAEFSDDLLSLFSFAENRNSTENEVARARWVRIFTDFVKTGNPTPKHNPGYPKWNPYTPKEEKFMHVGNQFIVKNHILEKRIKFWRQLAQCQTAGVCEQNPVVNTAQGMLRGQQKQSVAGCLYYSWNGIPYAKPPLGELRFKDAQPAEPWEGVRDALQDGSACMQATAGTDGTPDGGAAGNEDCLYMNVFSPQMPTWLADSLPVMSWVHGGGLVTGSSSQNVTGPDYFVCEGVILVAHNYRLGVFGFLYLEKAAPGNVGLKDQVAALRWEQRNIAAFAGDPGRVTVAGESGGAAAVHLLTLSPMTKGLFQRAIVQSGNAVNRWAIQTAPLETSKRLAAAMNCSSSDNDEIANCLRKPPPEPIVVAAFTAALTEYDRNRLLPFTFLPTNDLAVPGVELFLPAPAIDVVKYNMYSPVPLCMGINSRESFLDLAIIDFRQPALASALDASWDTKILPELALPLDEEKNQEALNELRNFYMDGEQLTNKTLLPFMDMLTDIQFGKAVYFTMRQMAEAFKQTTLHLYYFDVSDALNVLKIQLNAFDIPGAGHAEELAYLFHVDYLPTVPYNSTAASARRRMVRLWCNYIKFGDPTPYVDPLLQGVRWKPYRKKERNYLEIGSDLKLRRDLNKKSDKFWQQFYRKYGHK